MQAALHEDGALALLVDGKQVAQGKISGPIQQQPRAGFTVGSGGAGVVGDNDAPGPFHGKITNVRVKTGGLSDPAGGKN